MSQGSSCRSVSGSLKASFFGWGRLGAGKKRSRKVQSTQWKTWSTPYEIIVVWVYRYSLPAITVRLGQIYTSTNDPQPWKAEIFQLYEHKAQSRFP